MWLCTVAQNSAVTQHKAGLVVHVTALVLTTLDLSSAKFQMFRPCHSP